MSEEKHTPGPWQRAGWTPCGIYGPGGLSDAQRICRMDGRHNHDANARLIAAAPDMLAALQTASDFLADQVDVNWHGDGPNKAAQVKAEVDAAIARAEGRS